jgi:AbrB family transcriptional regulator, stage V sporulation protein T
MKERHFMKATGIVRRIDDLGRIVVPKEIRRTLRLREGDPMEIYTGRDGVVMLKKYSPLHDMSVLSDSYVKIVHNLLGKPTFLCDKDQILAVAGASKGIYEGRTISAYLEQQIAQRQFVQHAEPADIEIKLNDELQTKGYMIAPINVNGDVIGALVLAAIEEPLTQQDALVLQSVTAVVELQYM